MQLKTDSTMGDIFIANNVIAEISGAVASKCYGVVGMAAKNPADGLVSLLKFDNITKGINVTADENGIKVYMHIIVEYGININTVCKSIVNRVKYALEKGSGIKVNKVYVRVEGVRDDD